MHMRPLFSEEMFPFTVSASHAESRMAGKECGCCCFSSHLSGVACVRPVAGAYDAVAWEVSPSDL